MECQPPKSFFKRVILRQDGHDWKKTSHGWTFGFEKDCRRCGKYERRGPNSTDNAG